MQSRWPARQGESCPAWEELIPTDQWAVFDRVIALAIERKIDFAIGGGFAFSHYARRWRNTKDMDFYVQPRDRRAMIECTLAAGMEDYFAVHDYDRSWIYRSHNGAGIIVDIIWQMANGRAAVDEQWLNRGDQVEMHGRLLRMLPVEELIWSKLYVVQRERCDWPDLLNILNVRAGQVEWERLLSRVGEDRRLIAAVVELFTWACPAAARELAMELWQMLAIRAPLPGEIPVGDPLRHVRLLDSRDWFGPK